MFNSKRLMAAAAAGFMALNTMGVSVFAADGDGNTSINIIKTLNLHDEDLNAPNASFSFSVNPATVAENVTWTSANNEKFNVYSGIENGLTAEGSNLTANSIGTSSNGVVNYTGAKLVAAQTGYTAPGIYRYTVTENDIDTSNKGNEDITKDSSVYTVDVVVQYNTAGTALEPAAILVYKGDPATTKKSEHLQFDNNLATTVSGNSLTVTKKISGTQGIKTKKFPFTVTVNGAAGDVFKYTTDGGTTWQNMTATPEGVNTADVQLADGESVMVKGLSRTDTYSVKETNKEDYTLDISGADVTATDEATGNVSDKADNIIFTNTKNGIVPTGILMTAAPYAGMIGLGGIFAGLFFRKKRED